MRISKLGLLSDFLNVVNRNLKETITPGDRITLSESMVKSFHKGLKKVQRRSFESRDLMVMNSKREQTLDQTL